ncbi:MAG: hypothetical protein AAF555_03970 [Verrucomicrobiota bacterium]
MNPPISPSRFAIWTALLGLVVLSACSRRDRTVEITDSREVSPHEREIDFTASPEKRFQLSNAGIVPSDLEQSSPAPSPPAPAPAGLMAETPPGWKAIARSQFRDLNYLVDPLGEIEAYATLTGGTKLMNVNRWYGELGMEPLSESGLATLERIPMLGDEAVLFEQVGTYRHMRRGDVKKDFKVLGAVAEAQSGRLVTMKMFGPREVVEGERANFLALCASLKLVN